MRQSQTPVELGYRMPAEWESHAATWLAWPHERADWPGKLAPIPWVYGEVVRHLAPGERVRILVKDATTERKARAVLVRVGVDLAQIDFFRVATDRSWTRDFCPLFVKSRDRRRGGDDQLEVQRLGQVSQSQKGRRRRRVAGAAPAPSNVGASLGAGPRARRIVLEGGSIDVNGSGTLLTTEECLLSPIQARNPGVAREDLERVIERDHLGVRKVLWLGNGIVGDDTHGHVDDLARASSTSAPS